MKIDFLKLNLRRLVLLAKEYKEKIPTELTEEIAELKELDEDESGLDKFSRQRLEALKEEKQQNEEALFNQLIYFGETILCGFSKPMGRAWHIEIDQDKVNEAFEHLSEREIELLSALWELHINIENLKCYKKGTYNPNEVRELRPQISKLVKSAISVDS